MASTYINVSKGRATAIAASPAVAARPSLLDIAATIAAVKPTSRDAAVTVVEAAFAEVVKRPNNASATRR